MPPAPLPPRSSPLQLERLSEALDAIEPKRGAETGLGRALMDYGGRTGRRELIIVLSDLIEDLQMWTPAVLQLRAAKHEILLLHILHADEVEFPFDDPYLFQGYERAGSSLVGKPGDIANAYRDRFDAYQDTIRMFCSRNGVGYHLMRTDVDSGSALLELLNIRRASPRP
jgi:hypothetical protein